MKYGVIKYFLDILSSEGAALNVANEVVLLNDPFQMHSQIIIDFLINSIVIEDEILREVRGWLLFGDELILFAVKFGVKLIYYLGQLIHFSAHQNEWHPLFFFLLLLFLVVFCFL